MAMMPRLGRIIEILQETVFFTWPFRVAITTNT
jgi:hypothetical protein